MDFLHLIGDAELILQKVKVGDIFGIDSKEEYIDDETLAIAKGWVEELYNIGIQSNNPLGKELCETWYLNGNRVNRERIQRAIEILKQLQHE